MKKKVNVAIFSHFDSRGGSSGYIMKGNSIEELNRIFKAYTDEFIQFNPEDNLRVISDDFQGIKEFWLPEELLDQTGEILYSFDGKYNIIEYVLMWKDNNMDCSNDHRTGVYEVCKNTNESGDDEVMDFEDPELNLDFNDRLFDRGFRFADDDFSEDAYGLILFAPKEAVVPEVKDEVERILKLLENDIVETGDTTTQLALMFIMEKVRAHL